MTMPNPLLIFDGDCTFCRRWIERWQDATQGRVDFEPYQTAAQRFPAISVADFQDAVHFIHDGKVNRGARAVFSLLSYDTGLTRIFARLTLRVPVLLNASERVYRWVATHRPLCSRLTQWLFGRSILKARYARTNSIFLRGLGWIYAIAFASLGVQIKGLYGKGGILPVAEYLHAVFEHFGGQVFFKIPSIFWCSADDQALLLGAVAGVVMGLLVAAGFACVPLFALLWFLYLSYVSVGGEFLSFQWDTLLLETGFLALFLTPLRPRKIWEPPALAIGLARLLTFRLLVGSGLVKWLSGDPSWRNLSALQVHYQTQPLPTPLAWYAHQAPLAVQKATCLAMFAVELLVPVLFFAPRRLRHWAATLQIAMQVVIILTGNYGFFNLLTICLCVLLYDDEVFIDGPVRLPLQHHFIRRWLTAMYASLAIALSAIVAASLSGKLPASAVQVYHRMAPWNLVNRYGLFAVMTKVRAEIIVEGSDDQFDWKAYEFFNKPGNPARRLPWVAPHQPRLDWQMWFAALENYDNNPWFVVMCHKLLSNSPEVMALLESNPFSDHAPRYLRAVLYEYRFSNFSERRTTGAVWIREARSLYLPVISLENFKPPAHPF